MANHIDNKKTCATCNNCVTGAINRFRCVALPSSPGNYWDGKPEQHWCEVYWTPIKGDKVETVVKPPVKEEPVPNVLDKKVKV